MLSGFNLFLDVCEEQVLIQGVNVSDRRLLELGGCHGRLSHRQLGRVETVLHHGVVLRLQHLGVIKGRVMHAINVV